MTADDRLKAAFRCLSVAYDELDAVEGLDDLQGHSIASLRSEIASTRRRLRNVMAFRESLETSAGRIGNPASR